MATTASTELEATTGRLIERWQQSTAATSTNSVRLGPLIGKGTAHDVYSLDGAVDWVIRVKRDTAPIGQIALMGECQSWSLASQHGLAPELAAHTEDGTSICEFVAMHSPTWTEHADLMRAIHRLPATGGPLSLQDYAKGYWDRLVALGLSEDALSPHLPAIAYDLAQLDEDAPAFCHNDLGLNNIGRLKSRWVALDWEYAAINSRYFDVATAAQYLPIELRALFARRVINDSFCEATWQAAQRVSHLITHLWTLAELGELPHSLQRGRLQVLWQS